MKPIKFKTVEINLFTPNNIITILKNNNWIDYPVKELASFYDAEKCTEYQSNELFRGFNSYNWGSPITIQGSYTNDFEKAWVHFHIGGDVRGNYSEAYTIDGYDNVTSLLTQDTELYIELSNGEQFRLMCENAEAYFPLEGIDAYWIDFDEPLTEDQLEVLRTETETIN